MCVCLSYTSIAPESTVPYIFSVTHPEGHHAVCTTFVAFIHRSCGDDMHLGKQSLSSFSLSYGIERSLLAVLYLSASLYSNAPHKR